MSKGIKTDLSTIQAQTRILKKRQARNYLYRGIEDINAELKKVTAKLGDSIIYDADLLDSGVLKVTCTLLNSEGEQISSHAYVGINHQPRGMSIEQAYGAAYTYGQKYAACALFAITDSSADPDAQDAPANQQTVQKAKPQRKRPNRAAMISKCKKLEGELSGMNLKPGALQDYLRAHFKADSVDALNDDQVIEYGKYLRKLDHDLKEVAK